MNPVSMFRIEFMCWHATHAPNSFLLLQKHFCIFLAPRRCCPKDCRELPCPLHSREGIRIQGIVISQVRIVTACFCFNFEMYDIMKTPGKFLYLCAHLHVSRPSTTYLLHVHTKYDLGQMCNCFLFEHNYTIDFSQITSRIII